MHLTVVSEDGEVIGTSPAFASGILKTPSRPARAIRSVTRAIRTSYTYIFLAELVFRKMYSPERAATNLFSDHILIDPPLDCSIVLATAVL